MEESLVIGKSILHRMVSLQQHGFLVFSSTCNRVWWILANHYTMSYHQWLWVDSCLSYVQSVLCCVLSVDAGDAVSVVPWGQEERVVRPISIHAGRVLHSGWYTSPHHWPWRRTGAAHKTSGRTSHRVCRLLQVSASLIWSHISTSLLCDHCYCRKRYWYSNFVCLSLGETLVLWQNGQTDRWI